MKYGLTENLIQSIQQVLETNAKVDQALLFGSRAKGNYREASDIDLALKGQDLTYEDVLSLGVKLDELNLPYKIDLLDYHKINEPALVEHIDRVGIEFYSRWREYKLSQLMQLIGGGTPKTSVSEYWGGNIPWLSVTDFNNGKKYCYNAEKKITEKGLKESSTKILKKGQIIISARGTVGVISMLGRDMAFNQSNYGVIANTDLTTNNFLYYLLKSKLDSFISASYGAVFDTITKETFNQISVFLPPLPEQIAIASILSSLDDKIDLLHRQNKTLEQLAETLFRQWFVVEADENWKEITLSKIAEHLKENIIPSNNPDKLFRHYSLPSFDEGKEPVIEIGKAILSNKYKIVSNSILVSKLNPRTPRIWMLFGNINTDECICSTEFQIVKPKDNTWFGFIYCFLKSNQVTQELAGASSGTSGSHQRVNPQDIFNLILSEPPKDLVKSFEIIANDYFKKIDENKKQISTLTKLRDTLLPKLMSGEVRVNLE